jgi:hypothetical protein
MSNILIGYDLNKTGQDYKSLIDAIKNLGSWWHCLDSTWIVSCNYTAQTVRDHLWQYMDSNDELFVVDITGQAAAWIGFTGNCNDWLKNNL